MLRRQCFTPRLDIRHGTLSASRHRSRRKLLAHHTGGLQHPPRLRREVLDAPHQQLPQPLRQTRDLGLGPRPQRPLPLVPNDQSLLHQMLHDVHHEQRIAFCALVDERGECEPPPALPGARPHTPPHPRRAGTPGVVPPPSTPTQLLHHPRSGCARSTSPPGDTSPAPAAARDRAAGPCRSGSPRWRYHSSASLRARAPAVSRRLSTSRASASSRIIRARRHPLDLALQALQLRFAHQPWELRPATSAHTAATP